MVQQRAGELCRTVRQRFVALGLLLLLVCGTVSAPMCAQAHGGGAVASAVVAAGAPAAMEPCDDPCCRHTSPMSPTKPERDASCVQHCLVAAPVPQQGVAFPVPMAMHVAVTLPLVGFVSAVDGAGGVGVAREPDPPLLVTVPLRI